MTHDYLAVVSVKPHKLHGPLGNIAVAGTVKSESPYMVLVIVLSGDGIKIRLRQHGRAVARIKNSHIGNGGHIGLTGIDTRKVCRIVERTKLNMALYYILYILIYKGCGSVFGASVKDSVSDSRNILFIFYYTVLLVE